MITTSIITIIMIIMVIMIIFDKNGDYDYDDNDDQLASDVLCAPGADKKRS